MAAALSVFWQAPLFIGIGVSEILCSVPAMEFFYANAPERMKAVCAALELLAVALGQWLLAGLIPLVNALAARARAPAGSRPTSTRSGSTSSSRCSRAVVAPRRVRACAPAPMRRDEEGERAPPSAPGCRLVDL